MTPVGIRDSYLGAQALSPARPRGHVQLSRMLLVCLTSAIAASAGLVVALATLHPDGPPPGAGLPPPRPNDTVLLLAASFFVLAWLATAVMFARDQILRRLGEAADFAERVDGAQAAIAAMMVELRRQIADDQQAALETMERKLATFANEYGDQREDDGYARGMKVGAEFGVVASGEVRALRPVRPNPPR